MGGKIIPRIRLTSAKDLVEVEAELGKIVFKSRGEFCFNLVPSAILTWQGSIVCC